MPLRRSPDHRGSLFPWSKTPQDGAPRPSVAFIAEELTIPACSDVLGLVSPRGDPFRVSSRHPRKKTV
jgi:hypothetical protein